MVSLCVTLSSSSMARLRSSSLIFLFFLQLLDRFLDVAANIAHRGAMVLEHLVQMLHHVLAAVFGQRRNRHAHTLPSFVGFRPRSAVRMALSISGTALGSHGAITIIMGSGTVRVPS